MATDTTKNQSWVQKTPGVCGGRACIRNTRITVWGVVNSRRLGAADEQILENIVGSRPRTSTRLGITTESIPLRSLRTFATTRRTDHLWPGQDPRDHAGLAQRIHDALTAAPKLVNQFIPIIRPNPPAKP